MARYFTVYEQQEGRKTNIVIVYGAPVPEDAAHVLDHGHYGHAWEDAKNRQRRLLGANIKDRVPSSAFESSE